ncbi:hypothetical protein [Reichenbachiella versicolor]|uniref:hypothetical protein n=1 Tax=Reichenbachiella versicolor TaxID=1821036 RepID=UPI000D6E6BE9|nr:hypothetical protein [Reichenbachiella versicolor]
MKIQITTLCLIFLVGVLACETDEELEQAAKDALEEQQNKDESTDEDVSDENTDDETTDEDSSNNDNEGDSSDQTTNEIVLTDFPVCEGITQPARTLFSNRDDANSGKCGTFLEENGMVIFEAENTISELGDWTLSSADTEVLVSKDLKVEPLETKTINDHIGEGYLKYVGGFWSKDKANYNPSPLVYKIKVQNTGSYRLMVRSIKSVDKNQKRHDTFNDCFVKMEGNFQNGQLNEECKERETDKTLVSSTYHLKKETKYFGASNKFWAITGMLDAHLSFKPWAVYTLIAGETYTFTVTGRSNNYHIDRWMLYDLHKYTDADMRNYMKKAVQSPCVPE